MSGDRFVRCAECGRVEVESRDRWCPEHNVRTSVSGPICFRCACGQATGDTHNPPPVVPPVSVPPLYGHAGPQDLLRLEFEAQQNLEFKRDESERQAREKIEHDRDEQQRRGDFDRLMLKRQGG